MAGFSTHLFLFIIPGIIGNVLHMVVVKKNILPFLAKPLSVKLFGQNKTFRGFLFLPLAMGLVCITESMIAGPFSISHLKDFLIGMGLGLVYMLSELPNSYIKRRLGIANGASSANHKVLQLIIDKTDSLLGASVFYFYAMNLHFPEIVLLFLISLILHFSISWTLVLLNLKKAI
jgi:hypothetical protein